jgi:hypothetical protein
MSPGPVRRFQLLFLSFFFVTFFFSTSAEANTGPIFARPFVKGPVENRPFVGSVMIVNDTDAESIREKLKSDIYTQEGIWDWENAEILPFHTLERTPAELEK